ncbi:MAG: hypothetical protein AAGA96_18020 [Verrucomicrobiota bacterium]
MDDCEQPQTEPFHKPQRLLQSRDCRALTLVELLVVLVILIGIGGLATTIFSNGVTVRGADGESRESGEVITLATMRTVRDALIGTSTTDPGYRTDLGTLPTRLAGLVDNIDGEDPFQPATKRGWRGPYIVHEGARYENYIESDTSDNFDDDGGNPYGINGDPAILDGWGKPVLLQQAGTEDARLVSAGADRTLETDPSNPIDADRGDDIVLFLFDSDPNL